MLSLHGILPISIKQNQLAHFIQNQIQKEKHIVFSKWWGRIDLFIKGLECTSIKIELKDNKLNIFFDIRIPVYYKLLFWKKETFVSLKTEFMFFILQSGRQPSFALDNSKISYFNVEGIPDFLNNLFTPSIENALEIEITRNLSNINHSLEELITKEWQFPFYIESTHHTLFINARQVRIVSINTENGIVKFKVALSFEADLNSQEFYFGDFVFLDIATDFRIQVTEDIIREILQSYLTSLHIPLISKNIPVSINELKLTKQFIELRMQFSEWFKGEYFIKLQMVSVHNEIHLYLIEMKSIEKLSLIKKGLAKAIEFGLEKIIENTAVVSFPMISAFINTKIESPLYFKIGNDAIKISIPQLAFKAIHQGEGEIDLDVGIEKLQNVIEIEF